MLGGQDCEAPFVRFNDCSPEMRYASKEMFEEGLEVAGDDDEAEFISFISSDPPNELGDSGQP
jgi:hypothetical protein